MINLYAAWLSMLLGAVAGAIVGLFFYNKDFLGGYTSWPRRMIRLGHIAFFGIGLIWFGVLLKVSYCTIVFYYWFTSGIPVIWKPFAVIDLLFIVLFVPAWCSLRQQRS